MTDIGAVIVNWNTADHLQWCIESLLKETILLRNIVVVDQNSTDGSTRTTRRNYPKIRILSRKENDSYGRAVNLGVEHLDTPFVVVANADAFPRQGCVRALSEVLEKDRSILIVGPRLYDESGKDVTRFSRTSIFRGFLLELMPKRFRGVWRRFEKTVHSQRTTSDVKYLEGSFMMLRRQLFLDIGAFDEGFTFFHEEADLCTRAVKSGFRVLHVPDAAATHAGGRSFAQTPLRHAREFSKNMVRYYERHALRRAVWLKRVLRVILKSKILILKVLNVANRPQKKRVERIGIVQEKYASIVNGVPPYAHWLTNPMVSVIIPTYNREYRLSKLLQSLRYQTYKNFEVIVVDQSEVSSKPKRYSKGSLVRKLHVVRTSVANRSIAKNVGLRAASGEVVIFCDDDIEPPPQFIETHVKHHRRPEVAGVSCRQIESGLETLQSDNICRVTFYGRMLAGYQSDTTCYVKTLAGGNMSVKKAQADENGYFDSLLIGTSIFEEQDFSARLSQNGKKILFTNDISVHHHPQPTGNTLGRDVDPVSYYHDFHHNEIVYFLKNRHRLCLLFVIPFCLLRSIKQSYTRGLSLRRALIMFSGVWHGFRSYYRSLS